MPGFVGHFDFANGQFVVDEQWDDSPEEIEELFRRIQEIVRQAKEERK